MEALFKELEEHFTKISNEEFVVAFEKCKIYDEGSVLVSDFLEYVKYHSPNFYSFKEDVECQIDYQIDNLIEIENPKLISDFFITSFLY